jgi:hypothetical protein
VVTHASDVTADETWAGDGVTHSVPNTIQIKAPATVTVQACAIVAIAPGAEIVILGDTGGGRPAKLVTAGTDDTTGFVSFEPATAGQPWGDLHGANEQSFLELHHTFLREGGGNGSFARNSPIYVAGPGHFGPTTKVLKIDHVLIDHPVGGGVYLDTSSAFTDDSQGLGVLFAPDYPIAIEMMSVGTILDFSGQANDHDDALVIGPNANVDGDLTISAHIPIRIKTASMTVKPAAASAALSVTLTLQPGGELRFEPVAAGQPGARVVFGDVGQGAANRSGTLNAVGNALNPIVFTSGAETPAPGDWAGLQLLTATNSQLAFVFVEYAGAFSGVSSANCRPTGTEDNAALIIGSDSFVPPSTMLASSFITNSAGFGIDAIWENSKYDEPNLTDSSNANHFSGNAGCNQTYNGLTPGSGTCPSGGGCQPQ